MTFNNKGRYFVICLFFVARIHEPLDGANGQGKEHRVDLDGLSVPN